MTKNKMPNFIFGADSKFKASVMLQNNIDLFEWVTRNKAHPCFWGRNINGEERLCREEIAFLHDKACMIAPIYVSGNEKKTEEQGVEAAREAISAALKLGIPDGTAVFLEILDEERVTRNYLRGYAETLFERYIPAFMANTDAKYVFDREYSRGIQTDRELFSQCLIWATAPTVDEYNGITTTHLFHPDKWKPFAPSGTTRDGIAAWQYGRKCHRIQDDDGKDTEFNLNLIKDKKILNLMF